jgi:hypothetical protein
MAHDPEPGELCGQLAQVLGGPVAAPVVDVDEFVVHLIVESRPDLGYQLGQTVDLIMDRHDDGHFWRHGVPLESACV